MQLENWDASNRVDVEPLAEIAAPLFTAEMVARTFGTVLAEIDSTRGTDDMVRVARSAVSGLMRVRNGLLSRLLMTSESQFDPVTKLDRLRRRCDRWTDLLLATIARQTDTFEFAFEQERALDFHEDHRDAGNSAAAVATSNLISAGMILTFFQHLPAATIEEPGLLSLMQSILSAIPGITLHRDGSYRSNLEERIATSRLRMERRGHSELLDSIMRQIDP